MRCAGCTAVVRRTSLAYVAQEGGIVRRARVCGRCIARAIVVVPYITRVVRGRTGEDDRREAAEVMRAAVRKLKGLQRAYDERYQQEGNGIDADSAAVLQQAINVLEAGDY